MSFTTPVLKPVLKSGLFLAGGAAALALLRFRRGALGEQTTSSHSDPKRRAVGMTAFAVALLRAIETERTDRAPIARDEVARALFAARGPAPGAWRLARVAWWLLEAAWPRRLVRPPERVRQAEHMVDFLAVRTRFIDDALTVALERDPPTISQCVIVGSGLDARATRLRAVREAACFELDFAGVFEAKAAMFKAAGLGVSTAVLVATDLSASPERWRGDLLAAGFSPARKSTWLLEGLTGYLESRELDALLGEITRVAAPGSRLVATWLRDGHRTWSLSMHRSFVEDPSARLAPLGWVAREQVLIEAAGDRFGVAIDASMHGGYWLTIHEREGGEAPA